MIVKNYNSHGAYSLYLFPGLYKIECWGADGGHEKAPPSKGAYVSGYIALNSQRTFYLYVSEQGFPRQNETKSFNGGGKCADNSNGESTASSGGGASDVRLKGGNWDDFESLKSRIIVAGGGGGEVNFYSQGENPVAGGDAGILKGKDGNYSHCVNCTPKYEHNIATGGTQTEGGKAGGNPSDQDKKNLIGNPGTFGSGGDAKPYVYGHGMGGGSGGYFGGGSAGLSTFCLGSGAGGSSYISGGDDFKSITEHSKKDELTFGDNIRYSGFFFRDIVTKTGKDTNNEGDGRIKITMILSCTFKIPNIFKIHIPIFLYFICLLS